MAKLSDFKSMLTGAGARANQFRVELTFPSFVGLGVVAGQKAQFLCNAASLPASTIEEIPVFYKGRPAYVAGERTFEPWTISVYNDTTFGIRNALEQWSNGIQNLRDTNGLTNPADYQVDLKVHQLDRGGAIIKTYTFLDAWPTSIGAIDLSFEQNGQIETFQTTFRYNEWGSNTAESSGFGVNVSIDTPVGSIPL